MNIFSFAKDSILCLLSTVGLLLVLSGCGANGEPSADPHDTHDEHAGEQGHDEHADEGRTEIVLTPRSLESVSIQTVEVREAPVGSMLEFPGRVVPVSDQEAMVTALIAGRVEQVFVNEGERVRMGQVVAVVNGPELGDLVAELRHARADLDRQERLSERRVGVEKHLVEARTALAAAHQHLRSIGLSPPEIIEIAGGTHDIDGVPLRAPVTGLILSRNATLGGPVSPGEVLFSMADLTPIWVEADVYERDLALVSPGMDVRVRAVSAIGSSHSGTIRQIMPIVDRERRVSTIRIQLPNEDEALKPGMYATVSVATAGKVLPSLPVDAILTNGTQSYVIVADNDSTFRRVDVRASADAAGAVAIPELSVGTRVVTTGAFQIHSAMQGVEAGHAH